MNLAEPPWLSGDAQGTCIEVIWFFSDTLGTLGSQTKRDSERASFLMSGHCSPAAAHPPRATKELSWASGGWDCQGPLEEGSTMSSVVSGCREGSGYDFSRGNIP